MIYGSRAKGNHKKGSDLDLCLFGNQVDLHLIYQVHQALDELNLPYMFDLCSYSNVENKELIDHIDRLGTLFYQKLPCPPLS